MGVYHPEPEWAWLPMGDAEVVTCGFTDHIDTGTSIDDAFVNVASFDDDFHRGVLGVLEGWPSPWLGKVDEK